MMALCFRKSAVRPWAASVAFCAIAAFAYAQLPDEEATPPSGLTAEEPSAGEREGEPLARKPAAEPPPGWSESAPGSSNVPVSAAEATDVQIEVMGETGYVDEQGRYVVDLLERDYAYLAVMLETGAGRPVQGAVPTFSIEGTSRLLRPGEVSSQTATNENGVVEFALIGGQMSLGRDLVRIEFGAASAEILVNVISLRAAGFPMPPAVEGSLPWEDLMRARVQYRDMKLFADFPPEIADLAGQTVKVWGFMMPLEPDLEQRRFLLASNPPSCFFHVPGGPAGTVEVFAPEGIEVSWDAVVLEGRFEPQQESETGVVYRLHDARLAEP